MGGLDIGCRGDTIGGKLGVSGESSIGREPTNELSNQSCGRRGDPARLLAKFSDVEPYVEDLPKCVTSTKLEFVIPPT